MAHAAAELTAAGDDRSQIRIVRECSATSRSNDVRETALGGASMVLLEPGDAAAEYKAKILSYQAGADFLALQASAPEKLASLIEGLSSEELGRRPAPDKWSIQELVAHLADDELVGGYRIRLILSSPGTEIQAFDQDVWSRTGRYDRTEVRSSLEMFRVLRQANLRLLRSLRREEWDMFGVHAERGMESIRDIAMYYAGHDINHFEQIEAIRSKQRETSA
jgi:uncharacterized damage-inducible protein DinB